MGQIPQSQKVTPPCNSDLRNKGGYFFGIALIVVLASPTVSATGQRVVVESNRVLVCSILGDSF